MYKTPFRILVAGLLVTALFVFPDNAQAFGKKAAAPVWVVKPDGARSCEKGSGQTLEKGAEELQAAKVRILESRKGHDGKMYAQVCGGPTGALNTFLIAREDLSQATALGYQVSGK